MWIGSTGHKPKFVCFNCRKMFKIEPSRWHWDKGLKQMVTDHLPVCPECGTPMRQVGREFKPPRHADQDAWEAAELLYRSGHPYMSSASSGSRRGLARPGKAKRFIEANPHRRSEGQRLLARFRKRRG